LPYRAPHVDLRGEVAHQLRPQLADDGLQRPGRGDAELVQHRSLVHPPGAAGRQVIDHRDLVAPGEQGIGQVRADEACAAGHEYSHGCSV
jgi:hypothetical protein